MQSTEEWRPVPGWDDLYEVSSSGSVRALPREITHRSGRVYTRASRFLKPRRMSVGGHVRVALYRNYHREDVFIHRLVLLAFVGTPDEGQECCHNNGIPDDNRLENLRWGTRAENVADAIKHGVHLSNGRRAQMNCKRGHPLSGANLYLYRGLRGCRTCRRMHDRKEI